jgi:hypothetical protein
MKQDLKVRIEALWYLSLSQTASLKGFNYKSVLIICIPLALSAYTHLWNPIGFPAIHVDEGTYMRRALHVIDYFDPQGGPYYDHPYFGQLFLATMLSLVGYPDSLHPSADVQSIEMLHLVPRVLTGLLAMVDTFLVYKIGERRYNNRVIGFIAATLFAVMPVTWLFRRVLLDTILLPFLLGSILFAVYLGSKNGSTAPRRVSGNIYKNDNSKLDKDSDDPSGHRKTATNNMTERSPITTAFAASNITLTRKNLTLTVLSGAFLGLAVFTKIPIITMIPLVGFLVFTNSNRSYKALGLWFAPVILIPFIWPAYAISQGEFDDWLNTVSRQVSRESAGTISSLGEIFYLDPIFIIVGAFGYIYAAIKRDLMLLLWLIPFVILFTFAVHYINWFHWIPLLPAFSIAAAAMIVGIPSKLTNKSIIQKALPVGVVSAIGIFGLISTSMLITTNLTVFQFQTAAYVANHLLQDSNAKSMDDRMTVISSQIYSWIFRNVFDEDNIFSTFRDRQPIETGKVILVVDNYFKNFMSQDEPAERDRQTIERLKTLDDNSNILASFEGNTADFDRNMYPYYSMKYNFGGTRIQIKEAVEYNDKLQTK